VKYYVYIRNFDEVNYVGVVIMILLMVILTKLAIAITFQFYKVLRILIELETIISKL